MADPNVVFAVLSAMAVGLGLHLVLVGVRHRPARLGDALHQLDEPSAGAERVGAGAGDLPMSESDLASRLGAWAFVRLRLPLADRTRRILALRGRSIGDFVAEKLVYALIGLALPLAATAVLQDTGHLVRPVPLLGGVCCAVLGFFWPDLALRRQDESVRADAGEALFTYLDLVTLERLANASAAQALMSAATLSDAPLFRRIRLSLERARLEQLPPWNEMRRLAEELNLPQLADIADVMRLDEQGAALADALRARVAELRDAHLTEEKVRAQATSERMTVWMVVPSMVLGLVFLTPPVLKLMGLAG